MSRHGRSPNDEVGDDVRAGDPAGRSRTIARVPGRAGELEHLPASLGVS